MAGMHTFMPLPLRAGPDSADVPAPLDLPALLGAQAWARLPAAVRRRFQPGHGAAVYAGHMDLHCSTVGRLFAALSRLVGAPLTGRRERSVPARVHVHDDGRGGVVWERRFAGRGGEAAVVRSTKELDRHGRLFERTDGGLGMVLRVFEHEGSLVFESQRYELVLGGWRFFVPRLFSPGTCRVTHTDLGNGQFRFTLDMTHPLWGRTFQQTGVFADPGAFR
jgi:hypothetical protein